MVIEVFDRQIVRARRERAEAGFARHDFLFRECGARLAERVEDVSRRFDLALDLGGHGGILADALLAGGRVDAVVHCDLSERFARRARAPSLVADEEALPFRDASFDLIASNLALHWTNDLPGALVQARRALKSDGLFLGALFGGETLVELRACLLDAELAEDGGASPRVSPMAEMADMGGLLQRAGFALPVVDQDRIEVSYPDALALMRELRAMGESNAVAQRTRRPTRRATLARAAALYAERFGRKDGRIPATFQVFYLTAWTPHPSQQQPRRPGSAHARLADALGATETSGGVAVGRREAETKN